MKNILNDFENSEDIDITPDLSLLPKQGSAGYSIPQAVAELVDNSIDARIDGEELLVNINISRNEIIIADNGSGMNKDVISKSLKLGFSKKTNQLGEFGLGMKTACLSLGDIFTVMTKSINEDFEYNVRFDKYEWESKASSWKLKLNIDKNKTKEHFTIIKIEKIKTFYPNLAGYIRQDLQKRYSPFIKNQGVHIKINGLYCRAEEIKIIEETKKEFNIKLKNNNAIYGWYALLREGSQKGLYGFDTYRRGRMITSYDKIGFSPHPTLARIVGVINMDHVPVTPDKREFRKESYEYKGVEEAMTLELKDLVRDARKKATQETITKDVENAVSIWKDKIVETLRSQDFKRFTTSLKEDIKVREGEDTANEIEIEKRNARENKDGVETKTPETSKSRTPQNTQIKKKHTIRVKGKNINFDHKFVQLGFDAGWKTYNYTKEKGLEVFTNIDFPAYSATKDKAFYAVIHIAEAIAEFFIKSFNEDISNVDEIKELILRKASKLKEELD